MVNSGSSEIMKKQPVTFYIRCLIALICISASTILVKGQSKLSNFKATSKPYYNHPPNNFNAPVNKTKLLRADTIPTLVNFDISAPATMAANNQQDTGRPGNTCDTYLYEEKFGSDGVDDHVNAVTALSNGNVVITGYTGNYGLVMELDKKGNILWQHRYASAAGSVAFKKAAVAAGGTLVVIGSVTISASSATLLLCKISAAGIMQPVKITLSTGPPLVLNPADVMVLSSGNIAFLGDDGTNIYAGITNPGFGLVWARPFTIIGETATKAIRLAEDYNGLLFSATGKINGFYAGNLLKVDLSIGTIIWSNKLGGVSAAAEFIFQDMVYQDLRPQITAIKRNNNGPWVFSRVIMNTTGMKETVMDFKGAAFPVDETSSSAITSGGETMSIYTASTKTLSVIRSSPSNVFIWAKQYNTVGLAGIVSCDRAYDGGSITAANTINTGTGGDMFIMKADSAGITGDCGYKSIDITHSFDLAEDTTNAPASTTSVPGLQPAGATITESVISMGSHIYCSNKFCPALPVDTSNCFSSFAKRYNDYAWSIYPGTLTITKNKDILITGAQRDNPYVASSQSFVLRLDSRGNVLSSNKIRLGGPGYIMNVFNLDDGNFITLFGAQGLITFCKHDALMNVIWQKTYAIPYKYYSFSSITKDDAGNMYLSWGYSNTDAYYPDHYSIQKITVDGNFAWIKTNAMPSTFSLVWNGILTWLNGFLYSAMDYHDGQGYTTVFMKVKPGTGDAVWIKQLKKDNTNIELGGFGTTGKNLLAIIDTRQGNQDEQGLVMIGEDGAIAHQRKYIPATGLMNFGGFISDGNSGVIGESVIYGNNDGTSKNYLYFLDSSLRVKSTQGYNTSLNYLSLLARDSEGSIYQVVNNAYFNLAGGYYITDDYYTDFSLRKFLPDGTSGQCPTFPVGLKDTPMVTLPAIKNLALSPGDNYIVQPSTAYYPLTDDYVVNEVAKLCGTVDNCLTLKVTGTKSICNTSKTYTYSLLKSPGCTQLPLWVFDTSKISAVYLADTGLSVQFKKPGSTTLKAVLNTGCNVMEDSIKITIAGKSDTLDLGADNILCAGDTIALKVGPGFLSYKWQDNSTDSSFSVTKAGVYFVSVTDACLNGYADTVKILADTMPGIQLNDTSKCNGDSIRLQAPASFSKYNWLPAQNISRTDTSTVWVYPPATTQYIVSAVKSNGCPTKDTIKVTVLTSPAVHLGSDTAICYGDTLLLDVGSGFTSWRWSTGASSQYIQAAQAATYFVKATTANGCSSNDTLTILAVKPLPVFSLGNDTALCQGQVLAYNFNLTGAIYQWSTSSMAGSQSLTQAGTYWLRVTQQGCSSADSVTVAYNPVPVVNLGSDLVLCPGEKKLLDAGNPGASYVWNDGSTAQQYNIAAPGSYSVKVTLQGCIGGDTITAIYLPTPLFTLGSDTFICKGTTLLLSPAVNTPVSYLWQNATTNPTYTITTDGIYSLTVGNKCGIFTDSLKVTMGLCNLLMPSAFSPNRDGVNDVFRVKYPFPVKTFNMAIYNRWGQKIFESSNITKGWDGTYQGLLQPVGTYIWVISLVDGDGASQSGKGTVVLIK